MGIEKIKIWKLASEFQFSFFCETENWYQILIFVFLRDWKLKFDVEFQFSIFLENENWKLKCIFVFQFSRKTVGTRVHAFLGSWKLDMSKCLSSSKETFFELIFAVDLKTDYNVEIEKFMELTLTENCWIKNSCWSWQVNSVDVEIDLLS